MTTDRGPQPRPLVELAAIIGCAIALVPEFVAGVLRLAAEGERWAPPFRLVISAAVLIATVVAMVSTRLWSYYLALVLQLVLVVALVAASAASPALYVAVLTFVAIELSFIEPYPRSLFFGVGTLAASLLVVVTSAPFRASALPEQAATLAAMIPLLGMTTIGPLVTRYREMAAKTGTQRDQLGESVVRLTRANSEYQDFAVRATERAAEQERLRITRQIHDVVGYTLTNNIMLMEAALRLMQENVLALPSIIETARTNAQDGLVEIRKELYKLRQVEPGYPSGVKAIHRLVRMFQEATGVEVRCEFGNAPWSVSEAVDSAVYHLVQECLVNSFRHGKADRVQITFWMSDAVLQVDIDDNGVGATEVNEGIGLTGMRERLGSVNGSLVVIAGPGRFAVRAIVPIGNNHDK